ncbi:MAG: 6,7-dimethyl-8-ribityllumazine synthase [Ignavibacteriae bacterium]|nr:6,7-dimethyl-8-ribityllumazine synthase [Ignavibacteriota bacterium]
MNAPVQGDLQAGSSRFAIVASRFNDVITRRLIEGATDCLLRHGADPSAIDTYICPGSFEIPLVASRIAATKKHDAIVCLGAVIKGDTPHNEYIAAEVTKGIAQLMLQHQLPISFGILTTNTLEQALERAGLKHGNKGWEAALSALEMVNLLGQIEPSAA